MKIRTIIFLLIVFASCKDKKKEEAAGEENGSFPVLALIKSQVAKVDSSLFAILQIDKKDSLTFDTVYLKADQFRDAARDFISIPDIADKNHKGDYKELKQYMQDLQLAVFTYTATDPEAEIRSEEVYISKSDEGEDKVERIIIDKVYKDKKTTVRKNMIWKIDSHFQVATYITEPGVPDKTSVRTVQWTDPARLR